MDNRQNEPEQKKGFPGGVLIFLVASVLLFLTIQNLVSERTGKVSFSHQVEHLMNLDLLHKDENKKIALKDNLVTFSGRFKEELSESSKERYRYLELLSQHQSLNETKQELAEDLESLKVNVEKAANQFLLLSGTAIPKGGFRVVSPIYDTDERSNAIILKEVTGSVSVNLPQIENELKAVSNNPTKAGIERLGNNLQLLVHYFRAPTLGIGQESMKRELRTTATNVDSALSRDSKLTLDEKLGVFTAGVQVLKKTASELVTLKENVSLSGLRSTRSYLVDLEQYQGAVASYNENTTALDKARLDVSGVTWFFNNKELSTKALEKQSPESFNQWYLQAKNEWENFASNHGLPFKAPDQPRNGVLEKTFKSEEPSPNYFSYIFTFLPVLLVMMLLYFVFSKQMKGMGGGGAMNFGKSPAKLLNKSTNKVTFADVAGVEEAKEELQEIVDFLKNPGKFTALGARIPKGVLCVGPPGTGKTLIARAVAGEADRPFFSISGSDFVEMFVGVGASRIRDLFDQAKKAAPCIIFIDEIDAVGRHRGAGVGGGHDEREQTLNQLLVEMDGFDTNEGVILIAATNRPDVLDKALLRPGRFDRRIHVDLPDIKGRKAILDVHAQRIKLDPSVDLMHIARSTPGSSGADLMNILNEAALLAARNGRSCVTQEEAIEACDKVRYGKERRSLQLDDKEKRNTAYHESGHAIVGLVVDKGDPVEKVTIIPRGFSLGATHFVPEKNKVSYWKAECIDRLAVLMGGRIAEEQFLGDVSSGAQMDITQATKLARSMVCEWGMTDTLGAVAYDSQGGDGQYMMPGASSKNYSEETAQQIDAAVRKLCDEANARATQILLDNKEKVELMSEMLLEFEVLDRADVDAIMDGSWSTEEKKARVKEAEGLHKGAPPPPLPPKKDDHGFGSADSSTPTPQGI